MGDQLNPNQRATTTAGTATADKVCADCAADTYAAGYWADCAAITACGTQLTCGARVEVDAATTTADRTCTACAAGTYEGAGRNCVECTAISGASAVTCTSGTDSRAATCVTLCPKKLVKLLTLVTQLAKLVTGMIPTHVPCVPPSLGMTML